MENSYNLEERTALFSKKIIILIKSSKKDPLLFPILSQLLRAATSVGANYCEANGASSRKDFLNKIYICKKEAKETHYWLRLLETATPEKLAELADCRKEVHELTLIFSKIAVNAKNNQSK